MGLDAAFVLLLLLSFLAANLPWLSNRVLFVLPEPRAGKREWVRLLEWMLFYGLVAALGAGLEYRIQGELHVQDWEFYVTTICLFLVFALPGFIYHHDLRWHLRKRGARWR